ncbi:MAG: GIY-YIG nuclease family protein [Sphingobacteriaceae bacterium]|nr:MAG: GIY-YIG nuclease family protein [Sphingobacteriaceae bacterium]
MSCYIYAIVNDFNNKVYIGQTNSPHKRMLSHKNTAHLHNTVLARAIQKYGAEHFQMMIIETVTDQDIDEREIYWILRYNCLVPMGYNISEGGGRVTITQEMRDALSKRRLGTKSSDETRMKQSLSHKGRIPWNLGFRKEKIIQYGLNGTLIQVHETPQDALAAVTGITYSGEELATKFHNIGACIQGANGQKTAYKMFWKSQQQGTEVPYKIDVPQYKILPKYMADIVPVLELRTILDKATQLALAKEDYPLCGIHNSDRKMPLSRKLQEISCVKWCSTNSHYKDVRNEDLILSKAAVVKRLKGLTSWTAYLKTKSLNQ